jgi:hypothetical protein
VGRHYIPVCHPSHPARKSSTYLPTSSAIVSYIQEVHPNGQNIWSSARNDVHFALSHPNGWEGREQSQMRHAAVKAGLVPDTQAGHARIFFVTEGEAGLHFATENGVLTQTMEVRNCLFTFRSLRTRYGVAIRRRNPRCQHLQNAKKEGKRTFSEIAAPQCKFEPSDPNATLTVA